MLVQLRPRSLREKTRGAEVVINERRPEVVPDPPRKLARAVGADYSINIVELPDDPMYDVRKCVAYVEVEIIEGNVIVTIRRIDEAVTGPISVVIV